VQECPKIFIHNPFYLNIKKCKSFHIISKANNHQSSTYYNLESDQTQSFFLCGWRYQRNFSVLEKKISIEKLALTCFNEISGTSWKIIFPYVVIFLWKSKKLFGNQWKPAYLFGWISPIKTCLLVDKTQL
jgi:hypothetical protein